ncbi:CST complex subunit STN1 isoform X2 [Anolis carolinensis]|uniref:CST complex subunit STN1 isoform X2 n=1 Tax=Anolis carolinensis TaxID=28377 RepID=UPI0002038C51|nr:PREDICTED: CST complex subunit STN1 isoform X2 [Anolis carolinensis]|eukprot:XP_003218541.1 PREDICTED: CST complex subunit STN1 isoform X2 [Anolis carolinensis]
MSATATVSEAEVPSVLWGLNPIFSAFARLYIKDILEMTESKQVPGIFFYNRHPIKQVDILGTLVLIKERNAFHTYGVDDGTGVISCTCWKNSLAEQKSLSDFESSSCGLDLIEQIRKLQMAVHKKTNLQIGDLVRVRGSIRVYRQQREIKASLYYKVDDPAYEVQIARLLELPRLYRDIYDKPFQIPEETKSQGVASLFGSVSVLSEKIRAFLLRNKIQSFYKQDLETVEEFVDLIRQGTAAEQTDSKPHSFSSLIRESFLEAIRILENKGVLFQKSKNPNDMYYVTEQDRELHRVTLKVLKEDCKRPKYAEKGCHLRHIHNCVNQNYSPYVTEIVVRCLLDWLETNSDIVTTMEGYYTVF